MYSILAFVSLIAIAYVVPGAHQESVATAETFLLSSLWWVGLGVLSSIGLGTGLHTFVLYLGPRTFAHTERETTTLILLNITADAPAASIAALTAIRQTLRA